MKDSDKTKAQLIEELRDLKRRVKSAEKARAAWVDAKEALFEKEEKFLAAFLKSAIPMVVSTIDEGRYVEVNEAFCKALGLPREEIIGKTSMNIGYLTHAEREVFLREMEEKGVVESLELKVSTDRGGPRYVLISSTKVRMGGEEYFLSMVIDITQRRLAEDALRESERRYRELCESLPEIVSEFDEKGNFVFVNQNGFRTFGYTREDLDEGLNVMQMVAPEDRPRLVEALGKIMRGERTSGAEYKMIRKDGSTLTMTAYTNPIVEHGRVVGFRTILVDISDRLLTEEALRSSENRYRTLLESINDGVYILDAEGRFTFVNEVIIARTRRPREWFMGRHFMELIEPQFQPLAKEGFAANMRGEAVPAGEALVTYSEPPAVFLWVELSTKPLFEGDRVVGLIGTSRNITARKRAEEALKKSEERFRRLAENARDMIFRKSLPDGEYQYVSPAAVEITGYGPDDFYHDVLIWRRLVHPDWLDFFMAERAGLMNGQKRSGYEYKIIHRSGEERWVYQRDVLVSDEQGTPVAIEGMVTDISERKRAEEALKDSEEKYRSIFERSPLGIFQTTLGGRFIRANPALAAMLGYDSAQELVEVVADIGTQVYAHPGEREKVLRTVLRSRGQRVFENEYLRKDGTIAVGHLTLSVVRDESGVPLHLDGIVEDITDMRVMGEKLQRTMKHLRTLSHRLLEIQEKERRHIARELHDEIGQTLTALRISLKRTARSKRSGPARTSIDEGLAMVESLIRQVRNLSIELRPSILDDFGLTAALDWYINWMSARAGLSVEFRTDLKEQRLAPLIELTCFRIAQEALTNAVRHSGAKSVRVDLETRGGELHLTVIDDGAGFDVEKTYRKALKGKTFGLLGMEERANLAGGRLEFVSLPGKGTRVYASFPLQLPPDAA